MRWAVLPYAVAAGALLAPLVGGVAYLRFAAEFKWWMVATFFLWFHALTWALRRLQALGLARPGARLLATGAASSLDAPSAPGLLTATAGLGAALGAVLGQAVVMGALYPSLGASSAYGELVASKPPVARYVLELLRWGLRLGCPLGCLGLGNFAALHGFGGKDGGAPGALPLYPGSPSRPQLTLGEAHARDGARSPSPRFLTFGERAMATGVLITGLPGTGKTLGLIYPLLRQLVNTQREDPTARPGGLVLDAKGDILPWLRQVMAASGRLRDLYPIRPGQARINLLKRPDLWEPALAGYLAQAQENVQGRESVSPYWANAAQEFAMQALRALRLGHGRPPTLAALAPVVRSDAAFERLLLLGRARAAAGELVGDDLEELAQLELWVAEQLRPMADQTKASISSHLSTMLSVFEVPAMRRCFSPEPEEETFPGFGGLLEEGKVVVLSMPDAVFKSVGRVVGTLLKLSFQDAVLAQLARPEGRVRRSFFVADEFDRFVTASDSDFWARSRAARCANVAAIQSYSNLAAAGIDGRRANHLLSQLRTKVWLCADRSTAEAAAEECGREERAMPSRTVTENAHTTRFSFVDRMEIREGNAGASASTSWHIQDRYRFPPERFMCLRSYEAIALAFDGDEPLPPTVLYLTRDFADPNESWFDWRAREQSRVLAQEGNS